MEELALHILDVAENGIAAGARAIRILLAEDVAANRLTLRIEDDGRGMEETMRQTVLSPFVTTRVERRVGFGLALLEQSARSAEGAVSVRSQPGQGTQVEAEFALDHIDRPPLGDLEGTLMTLLVGNPGIEFTVDLGGSVGESRLKSSEILAAGGAVRTGYQLINSARRMIREAIRMAGFSVD